ncbi:MAG: ligase-associated DNA damage response endonuclease PdeM [Rhodobacteraceae bacterium]|nr:ligase-associated DNA damage response endonuclease PdeM [Paracoccaceae bacterium]
MNEKTVTLAGQTLALRPSGALFWPEQSLLCVSDLHLGKSERIARRGGALLPPYETHDTLTRLDEELTQTGARSVICLGDSFDDIAAAESLTEEETLWIARMQAGRDWVWVEGNHDPGPVDFGGSHKSEVEIEDLIFRHIATTDGVGELSGHFHPKARFVARGRMISRPCFLLDDRRLMLPSFGTYTGGLCWTDRAFAALFPRGGRAYLTGKTVTEVPMPVAQAAE